MTADLVEVCFEPGARRVWVQPGVTLLEAARAADFDIVTGCTRGMCGTDAVRIAAPPGALEQPAETERGTLERMGLGAEYRLSCSAVVRSGPIVVDTGAF